LDALLIETEHARQDTWRDPEGEDGQSPRPARALLTCVIHWLKFCKGLQIRALLQQPFSRRTIPTARGISTA